MTQIIGDVTIKVPVMCQQGRRKHVATMKSAACRIAGGLRRDGLIDSNIEQAQKGS